MGRKIPAKKHRGIKDLEKQRAKRLAELESRTNAAPKDPEEQAIPKSLERVIKLKEAAKTNNCVLKRKRRKNNALICVGREHFKLKLHPKAKPDKTVPVFQQRLNESGKQFLHRISKDTHAFLKETAFENKYGIRIERDPQTGQIQSLIKCKREKNDVEMLPTGRKNIERKKKMIESSLTKNEKRKLKLRLKKEKKMKNFYEFEDLRDEIAFNEVAREPPKLNIKPKKNNEERKPKNLLLNSLLKNSKKINEEKKPKNLSSNSLLENSKLSTAYKAIDRSGKRKNLPMIERRKLENQQSEAIAIYRRLKSRRLADRSC